MIVSTRGLARAVRQQWRFASSSSKAPRRLPMGIASPLPRQPTPYKSKHIKKPVQWPPRPESRSDDTLQSLWRRSWLPLTGAALLAGFLGFYVIGTATASLQSCPCAESHDATPTGRPPALTDEKAEQFDRELDLPEWWMGITRLRKRLARHATGHVLELAIGTGRNLQYYNWDGISGNSTVVKKKGDGMLSFTGLDISMDMLGVARKRLARTALTVADSKSAARETSATGHDGEDTLQLSLFNDRLRFIHSDAHRQLPSSKSDDAMYDTIIQTFGLCSVSDPVAVLCNLALAVKPNSGRIILLEHGKGWSGLVNGLLDRNAGRHFERYGCWWNRDIEALVEEAVRKTPGLEVVGLHRPNILQMGTLVWIELRMNPIKTSTRLS